MKNTRNQATREMVAALKRAVTGEVRFEWLTRQIYSTDASDYSKLPVGVVLPRSLEDISATVTIAGRYGAHIIPRGGGSSVSGQCVGPGLIIDHSKYLNRILEINPAQKWVHAQAGVVLDVLNAALDRHGLMVGPDPSSSAVATLGGMVCNNTTGSHSVKYGMMADHVRALEVVLSDGSTALLDAKDADNVASLVGQATLEGGLYKKLPKLLRDYKEDIQTGYPKTWRNVAGYNLDRLLREWEGACLLNPAVLVTGSEGTLANIAAVKINAVPKPCSLRLMILHFTDMAIALDHVPLILECAPSAVELMTDPTLALAMTHGLTGPRMRNFIQGMPKAILIVEFSASDPSITAELSATLEKKLSKHGYRAAITHCPAPEQIAMVWDIRKSVFGLMMSEPGDSKIIRIIDDAAVPVDHMADFSREVVAAGQQYGLGINFDAHASAGCLHMGLKLNLRTKEGLRHLEVLSRQIMALAIAHHGTTTGEHGEGLARSIFNEQLYGKRLHQAFKEVKAVFDPQNLFNPLKIVDAIQPWDAAWLKFFPGYRTPYAPQKTHLDFSHHLGFAGLVEMCNGMGVCRSQVAGTMCPSFKVTREELHSTRGRANALRAALTGQFGPQGLASRQVYEALDLCLACKACKKECAAGVDMAKLKSEFLAIYQAKHGVPLRSRIFGHMGLAGKLGSLAPRPVNALYRSSLFRKTLENTLKIDQRRTLPPLAARTFQYWFRHEHRPMPAAGRRQVVLWNDCHISYHQPELGRAAVAVLEAAGFEVVCLANRNCCGRPLISKGMLAQAKKQARHNVADLAEYARQGVPIIGIEPSCIACFRDEYPDLLRTRDARAVAGQSYFLEEFIAGLAAEQALSLPFEVPEKSRKILVHTHCYQKAFGTAAHVLTMLRLLPNTVVEEIPSGCCGMAGSFGYEKEHYNTSMAIGEEILFPAVRAATAGTIIAAAGTSCREQIRDGTTRRALHPIAIVADALLGKK